MPSALIALSLVGVAFGEDTTAPLCADFTPSALTPPGIDATCTATTETAPEFWELAPEATWTNAGGVTPNDDEPGFHQVLNYPAVANLTDDNGDGFIDEFDVPEIVVVTANGFTATNTDLHPGALTVIDGLTGDLLWSKQDVGGETFYAYVSASIGDLDDDGVPEICVPGATSMVVCVDPAGGLVWAADSPTSDIWNQGLLALGDMDGDGQAEVAAGTHVFSSTGALRGVSDALSSPTQGATVLVDWDGDGSLEATNGDKVWDADGVMVADLPRPPSRIGVADFDLDGKPDIVYVERGTRTVYVDDHDGNNLWSYVMPGTGSAGGIPTIGDLDGDGKPEVAVGIYDAYVAIDDDGTQLWNFTGDGVTTVIDNTAAAASVMVDLDGDGAYELVYADEYTLWIIDGKTGAANGKVEAGYSSATFGEGPCVADVDGDGSADIVATNSDFYRDREVAGVTVFGSATHSWRATRPIWNQPLYTISNVDEDGHLPRTTLPNWTRWNSFREQDFTRGPVQDEADLAITALELCDASTCGARQRPLGYAFQVENAGALDANDVVVQFVSDVGGVLYEETVDVPAGGAVQVGPITLAETPPLAYVEIVADGRNPECGAAGDTITPGRPPSVFDVDTDTDGFSDACDTCPDDVNVDQADADADGLGDVCDPCFGVNTSGDTDADGFCDDVDVCAELADDQADVDGDGRGDACDDCALGGPEDGDDDGLADACDACPTEAATTDDGCPVVIDEAPERWLQGGCKCDTGGGSGGWGLVGVAAAWLLGRRRRG